MNEMTAIKPSRKAASGNGGDGHLLIVSSYKRPCGIAQYVEHLESPLRQAVGGDLDIAALPVDLFRAQTPYARRAAAAQFQDVLERARKADVVNIQFELGLFGISPSSIWRRLRALLRVSRRVIITYHTVPAMQSERLSLTPSGLIRLIRTQRGSFVFNRLLKAVRANPEKFHHIVHTRREATNFELLGIPRESISAMPLAFLGPGARSSMTRPEVRQSFDKRYGVEGRHVIGCFGFLSDYKGIEVAVRALRHLPPDYHLVIVGGLHPEGIVHGTIDQRYMRAITNEVEYGPSPDLQDVDRDHQRTRVKPRREPSTSLSDRVHFAGALNNDDFRDVMAACDSVVLPYAEVGQTSSGPAAMALNLQRPVYCSRNNCFRELDRFQPAMLSFFEIGNHLELAQKILRQDGARTERVLARDRFLELHDVVQRARGYVEARDMLMASVA